MSAPESKELFADTLSDINFGNGMVRMDFASLSATDTDINGDPVMAFRQRIVMSPQGFLETFATMQSMIGKLEEVGMISRKEGSADLAEKGDIAAGETEGSSSFELTKPAES